MWIPTLKQVDKQGPQVRLIINYNDGTNNIDDEILLGSRTDVPTLVRNRITQLTDLYSFADGLVPGTVTPAVADPAPTLIQQHQTTFSIDWFRWQQIQKAVNAGILSAADANVLAFQTKVKNEFNQVVTDTNIATALSLL